MPFDLFDPDPEEKRRRRQMALTPGINPNAPPPVNLPKIALPGVSLPPSNDIPGGIAPPPPTPEPAAPALSRSSQLYNAKAKYLEETPGRAKSGLIGALEGLGHGGGLIGAVTGGLTGVIAPKRLQEQRFNERVRPQYLERFALEDQEQGQRLAAEKAARENAATQADIELKQAQAYKARQPVQPRMPALFNTPGGTMDTGTKTIIPGTAPTPKAPTQAELSIEPSSGKSYEQIAEESYQGRGGDKYVFDRLPPQTQKLLNGQVKDAKPEEIEAAQRTYQQAIQRERKSIVDYTRGDVRGRALNMKRSGGAKPVASVPGRKATVGPDFVKYVAGQLGVSPEKAREMIEADKYQVQ